MIIDDIELLPIEVPQAPDYEWYISIWNGQEGQMSVQFTNKHDYTCWYHLGLYVTNGIIQWKDGKNYYLSYAETIIDNKSIQTIIQQHYTRIVKLQAFI